MSFWHSREPPAPESDYRPHTFHHAKGPRALQKSIDRAQGTGKCERKDEPCAPLFQSVEDQHGCNGEEPKGGKTIQRGSLLFRNRDCKAKPGGSGLAGGLRYESGHPRM